MTWKWCQRVIPPLCVVLNFVDFGWDWHFMLCLFKILLILRGSSQPYHFTNVSKFFFFFLLKKYARVGIWERSQNNGGLRVPEKGFLDDAALWKHLRSMLHVISRSVTTHQRTLETECWCCCNDWYRSIKRKCLASDWRMAVSIPTGLG